MKSYLEKEAIEEAIDFLLVEKFYDWRHRLIFEAIQRMRKAGKEIDLVSICEAFPLTQLERIGGPAYIVEMHESFQYWPTMAHHAKVVHAKWARRRLQEIGREIIAYTKMDDFDCSTDECLEKAFTAISQLEIQPEEGFKTAGEIAEKIVEEKIKAFEEGRKPLTGIPTGFVELDNKANGIGGYSILAARPSMGKTAMAGNIAINVAREGGTVAFFSIEMTGSGIIERLLNQIGQLNSSRMQRTGLTALDIRSYKDALLILKECGIHLYDEPTVDPRRMRPMLRRLKRLKDKVDLVIVDYIQLIKPNMEEKHNRSREQEVSEISRGLKALSKEYPLLALAQLNRVIENKADKRPQLSDLRESGSLEQDADKVLFINRPEVYTRSELDKGKAEVIVAKNRNGETGIVPLTWV